MVASRITGCQSQGIPPTKIVGRDGDCQAMPLRRAHKTFPEHPEPRFCLRRWPGSIPRRKGSFQTSRLLGSIPDLMFFAPAIPGPDYHHPPAWKQAVYG